MAHGNINHVEFPADDPQRAMTFYSAVAGWEFSTIEGFDQYWVFRSAEGYGGAVGKRGVTAPEAIRDYIEVDSIEAALAAAEANGGSVKQAADDVPGFGRFAVVVDPEGSEVGLFQSLPRG